MLIGFRKVLYRTLVFGVDGKNPKPSFHQTFHHRSPRRLNRYRHGFRVTAGYLLQPSQQLRDGATAVFDDALGHYFSARIQHAHIVLLGCPIDSYKPTENHLPFSFRSDLPCCFVAPILALDPLARLGTNSPRDVPHESRSRCWSWSGAGLNAGGPWRSRSGGRVSVLTIPKTDSMV